MPSDYHHGVRVIEKNDGTRAIRTVETSIIGITVTANDADPTVFPLNKTVMSIGASRHLDKAGDTGTLARTLDAIKDQCEPIIYINRVEESKKPEETISNVIGGIKNGRRTGLQGLLTGRQMFGNKCRILGAPMYDKNISVAKELGIISEKMRAFSYVGFDAKTLEDAVKYRNGFGNKRQMIITPEFIGWDDNANAEKVLSASARALGLRAKIDNEVGWHKTLSNVPVNGVQGISKDIFWDPLNSTNDANYLNSHEVTTLINNEGYRFWGSRTCSSDPLFAFENYVRTGDVLADTMALGHLWAIDQPMSVPLFKDLVESAQAKMRDLTQQNYLLGGDVWFDGDYNPKELIKIGKGTADYDYTPVPPLEDLTWQQRITDKHIVNLTSQLSTN